MLNPALVAGVELILEKTAAERTGISNVIAKHAGALGLIKGAATQEQEGATQVRAGTSGAPSSSSSKGMEDKNKDYGHSADRQLDDDPSKKNGKADDQGRPSVTTGSKNITSEASGMPDLSLKSAADIAANARVLHRILQKNAHILG